MLSLVSQLNVKVDGGFIGDMCIVHALPLGCSFSSQSNHNYVWWYVSLLAKSCDQNLSIPLIVYEPVPVERVRIF